MKSVVQEKSEEFALRIINLYQYLTGRETNREYVLSKQLLRSVTSIGDSAFYDCTRLTEINYNAKAVTDLTSSSDVFENAGTAGSGIKVTFGDGVEKIPAYLFYTSNGVCPNISNVSIGSSVTSIGKGAFEYCSSLTSVTIGNSVTSIGDRAFYNCTGLTEINYNAKAVTDLTSSSDVFYNAGTAGSGIKVTFGDGVEKIPAYLFYTSYGYPPNISNVSIGSNVTSIGYRAFYGCDGLTSVTIGNSVTSIGSYAFYGCDGLTKVTIPDSVTSIGYYAFYDCDGLTSVTIGNSVTSIGDYAFFDCDGLTKVTIPDSVISIGYSAFSYCRSLTSVTIPDSVTSIGYSAFSYCRSLTSVTIPDSVTSIGDYAFSNCTGLTEINYNAKAVTDLTSISHVFYNAGTAGSGIKVTFGDGVEKIPAYLFEDCSSLTSVTIGNSVTSIGNYAFSRCTGLTEINYNAKAVTDLTSSSDVFYEAGKAGSGIKVTFGEKVKKVPDYLFSTQYSSDFPYG